MQHIGVREGNFLGVRRILVGISPNLPEKILGHFLCEHFLKQAFFWDDLQTRSSCDSANVGRHFCPDFQEFCRGFHRFYPDLHRFCPDFQHTETFGGALAPPPPTPLMQQYSDC